MKKYDQFRFDVPEAKRLASLAGAEIDMRAVIEYCTRLQILWGDWQRMDFLLYEALATTATIRYSRCFKTGVRLPLPVDALPACPALLKEVHTYVVDLRDKHFAHSVNPFEENEVTVQIGDHFSSPEEIEAINTRQGRAIGFGSDKPSQLNELANWWLNWIADEMFKEKAGLLILAKSLTLEWHKQNARIHLSSDTSPKVVGKRRRSL